MPKDTATYLGNCIRSARQACNLTQQELADQCHVAIKTVQKIENGTMNPSFDILRPIVRRLGISGDVLFYPELSNEDMDVKHLIRKIQVCNPQEQKFMLNTVDCMADQFLAGHDTSETEKSE